MSPLEQFSRPRWLGTRVAAVSVIWLLHAGLALGMPMASPAVAGGPGGTISFSGAIVTGTCQVPSPTAANLPESVPSRGDCRSGESHPAYRLSMDPVGEHPGSRLLQYAKDAYGNARVLTYEYE